MIERILQSEISDFSLPVIPPSQVIPSDNLPQYDITLADLQDLKLLNFRLYYAQGGRAEIADTIYLEDGNNTLDLCLEVFNQSQASIKFVPAPESQTVTQKKCHFYLSFAKEIQLNFSEIEVEEKDNWQVSFHETPSKVYIFFRRKSELILNSTEKVLLTLKNLTVNNPDIESTPLSLFYGKHSPLLLKDGSRLPDELTSQKIMAVTSRSDMKNIPLQFRFLGSNTIFNDGTSNNLTLKIFNRSLSDSHRPILLLDKAKSKFIITLETGDNAEALTTLEQAKTVSIKAKDTTVNWKVEQTPNQAVWTVTTINLDKLASGEGFELDISALKTDKASGVGYLYIDYKNIGDYPAGRLVVPIEKTPLLYRDQQVGIGKIPSSAKLHVGKVADNQLGLIVEGPSATTIANANNPETKEVLRFVRPEIANQTKHNSVGFKVGRFETGSEGKTQLDITLSGSPNSSDVTVMSLRGNGNVGIGTTTPSAKLHVSDGNAIITGTGQVGIGIADPSAKLHVNGNIRLSGQIENGANGNICLYTNTSARNSNAWIELWGSQNSDESRTGELSLTGKYIDFRYNSTQSADGSIGMRLTDEGKVGIGTTTPKKELHVVGDLVLGKDENNNKFLLHSRKDTQGDFLQITNDKINGDWDWDQGIFLKRGGNVGIGTNTPSAKLDVNGSVKLGDGSTAWNRIICGKVVVSSIRYSNSAVASIQLKCYGKGILGFNRTSTGCFKIDFEKTIDPEKTVIIASTEDAYGDNFVSVSGINTNYFQIQTKDKTGNNEDTSFHFIAIELSDNFHQLFNS